jgi:leucyl-tRNA synthetase
MSKSLKNVVSPDDVIAEYGADIERMAFNTAIAAMMEFVNEATPAGGAAGAPVLDPEQARRFTLLLAPFAPHVAEEVWGKLGHAASIAHAPWPAHDPALLRDDTVELPIQIQGKVRARITVPAGADDKSVEAAALADPKIVELLAGKTPKKIILVPGKLVNLVI